MEIRPPYPQARMEHFLRVLGGQLGRIISTRLNTVAEQVRGTRRGHADPQRHSPLFNTLQIYNGFSESIIAVP